ncbi:MAG: flagellar biosynthetic protein FliO [Opitutales bacterium]|nr:flagellar biosynthetic protein FliO [Opitutales bacterium]
MMEFFIIAQVTNESLVGTDRWSGGGSFGLIMVTLVLFIALGLATWSLNRRGTAIRRSAGQNLSILETRSLGGRQFLMVVAYGEERFLLSVCPGRVEFLCPLPVIDEEDNPPAESASGNGTFGKIFRRVSAGSPPEQKS